MTTDQDFKNHGIRERRKEATFDLYRSKQLLMEGQVVVDTTEEVPTLLEVPESDAARTKANAEAINRINEVLATRFGIQIEALPDVEPEE